MQAKGKAVDLRAASQAPKKNEMPPTDGVGYTILAATVFAHGRLAALRNDWREGHCLPLVSKAVETDSRRLLEAVLHETLAAAA